MKEDQLSADRYWSLIESSQRKLAELARQLETLMQDELVAYQVHCWHAKEDVNPFSRFEEMRPLRIPCSEDQGDDFSAWVLGEGRAFFEMVRDHPAEIQKFMDLYEDPKGPKWETTVQRKEYQGFRSVDLLAKAVYRKRFREDLDEAVEAALEEEFGN